MRKYVVSILVENNAGVLRRVSGLFSRRNYNITSLSVGETHDPLVSRITVVVEGTDYTIDQVAKQVCKLPEVITVERLHSAECVYRELALVRIATNQNNRSLVLEIANIFRARVVDFAENSIIVEITGDRGKVDAYIKANKQYEILELVRTGLTAIKRGNNQFLD